MLEKDEFLSAEVTGAVGVQRPNAMPGVPSSLPGSMWGSMRPPCLSAAGRSCGVGSCWCPRSRALVIIIISVLLPYSQAGNQTPQTRGQGFYREKHPDGRDPFIRSFIQPAFTVPGADAGTGHVRLMRTDAIFSLLELTS